MVQKKQQRSLVERHGNVLEGISEDGPNELQESSMTEQESDMKMLEKLFKKVQSHGKIDKVKLLK